MDAVLRPSNIEITIDSVQILSAVLGKEANSIQSVSCFEAVGAVVMIGFEPKIKLPERILTKLAKIHDSNCVTTNNLNRFTVTPLFRITFGQHKSDNNNRIIAWTSVFG